MIREINHDGQGFPNRFSDNGNNVRRTRASRATQPAEIIKYTPPAFAVITVALSLSLRLVRVDEKEMNKTTAMRRVSMDNESNV